MRQGKGICNGTFGELVQGILGERPFLITLPIPSLRSEAIFLPDKTVSEINGFHSKGKAIQACEKLCQRFSVKGEGYLLIRSNIPVGKGMASSSADIVAAMKAIAQSYSLPLTANILSSIATEIEPSDGVMYDDVVAYDYIHGELIENFGPLPPFLIVGIDVGGVVDTLRFNQLVKPYDNKDYSKFIEAYQLAKEGFLKKDLSLICKASTISANINQKILPKPFFNEVKKLAETCCGGLVIAHSGTVLGILLDRNDPNINQVLSYISRKLSVIAKNSHIKILSY